MPVLRECETRYAFARHQSRQPARMLFRVTKGMKRLYGKRALHRRQRAQAGVGPFQLLHDEAIRRVTQSCASMLFEVGSIKAQRAHAGREMFRKLARTMAGHNLGKDFLLNKTLRSIACRALVVREKILDAIVI